MLNSKCRNLIGYVFAGLLIGAGTYVGQSDPASAEGKCAHLRGQPDKWRACEAAEHGSTGSRGGVAVPSRRDIEGAIRRQREADEARQKSQDRLRDRMGGSGSTALPSSSGGRTTSPGGLSGQIDRLGERIRQQREREAAAPAFSPTGRPRTGGDGPYVGYDPYEPKGPDDPDAPSIGVAGPSTEPLPPTPLRPRLDPWGRPVQPPQRRTDVARTESTSLPSGTVVTEVTRKDGGTETYEKRPSGIRKTTIENPDGTGGSWLSTSESQVPNQGRIDNREPYVKPSDPTLTRIRKTAEVAIGLKGDRRDELDAGDRIATTTAKGAGLTVGAFGGVPGVVYSAGMSGAMTGMDSHYDEGKSPEDVAGDVAVSAMVSLATGLYTNKAADEVLSPAAQALREAKPGPLLNAFGEAALGTGRFGRSALGSTTSDAVTEAIIDDPEEKRKRK